MSGGVKRDKGKVGMLIRETRGEMEGNNRTVGRIDRGMGGGMAG